MRSAVGLLVLGLVLGAGLVCAEQLPAKNQALLLLRILAYDHNLTKRADPKVVTVLVVYKADSSESESTARGVYAAVQELSRSTSVGGLPVRALVIPYAAKTFEADATKVKVAALYLSSGLDDTLGAITKVTRRHSMLSFTGAAGYIDAIGVALTVRDGKSAILVNLPATRDEGAQLDVALLRVAKVKK